MKKNKYDLYDLVITIFIAFILIEGAAVIASAIFRLVYILMYALLY